jgi:4-hydroxybutyrate CoA-transferase
MVSSMNELRQPWLQGTVWRQHYDAKCISMQQAAELIYSNDNVFVSGNAASPRSFLGVLAQRAQDLRNVSVYHLLLLGEDPFKGIVNTRERIRHVSFFVGSADRKAIKDHSADYIPVFLNEIPSLFYKNIIPLDVVYVMVSPPNEEGFVSLGVECAASIAAIETGKVVIAQVNKSVPFTYGETLVPVTKLHYIVEHTETLCELARPEASSIEKKIADYISPLIEDGSTLQFGIGGIPNAIMSGLEGRKDLGVHTEMFSDGMMELMEKGIITNKRKTVNPGVSIATFVLGSKKLYEFVNGNRSIKLLPTDSTNNPFLIGQNEKIVSINSAIEIDLTGQVCADSIGTQIYSGFGGQLDFVRGAAASKNGKAIIALPSMASGGTFSRIVPMLKQGAGVVTTRGDVEYVVTEYGIALLKGKTLRQRAESLIAIAHPNVRPELEQWFNQSYNSGDRS